MKKTRKWPSLLLMALAVLSFSACDDWGQMDPEPGRDVYPTTELVGEFLFDEEEGVLDPTLIQTFAYEGGDVPTLAQDELKGQVLYMPNGYARIFNPLKPVLGQNGAGLTFWMKQEIPAPEVDEEGNEIEAEPYVQDLTGALFSFQNEDATQRMYFTANGEIFYKGADGAFVENSASDAKTGYITPGEWHFVAINILEDGYLLYVDGLKKVEKSIPSFDCSKIVNFMRSAPYLYIGYGSDSQTAAWSIDELKIYQNELTSKEWKYTPLGGGASEDAGATFSEPVYFNDFNNGVGEATIIGGGQIKEIGGMFGGVFSNAMNGMRANYLKLPETVLAQSAETGALSIGVWVNRGNETASNHYMWSPLFTAYGSAPAADGTNGMPMLACQYRGVLQVNNNGWSDYTDAQNVNGVNGVYHDATDWLADGEWHYYTATFTATTAKVYFDGVIVNEWEIDGTTNTAAGLFSNGADLKYICLGGNQAWNWGDPDPGFWFDDIAIYNQELSSAQIQNIIKNKEAVYFNNFEGGAFDATVVGEGTFIDSEDPIFGKVFSNAMDGMRANYLLLPEDVLAHSVESQATSIAVWVNRGNESVSSHYMWSPLFTAYGAAPGADNTFPMLACQYRGVLQVNNAGWSDYTDAQNVNGVNGVYHDATDWLADGQWHLYTAVFTPTNAKVYFDGVLKNEWNIDGVDNTAAGLFSNGADLKYVCLGGNQAWNWGDPDPGFWFDDIAIYNKVLTDADIQKIILDKKGK